MTDHELCLAAAKAAGYTVESYDVDCFKNTGKDGIADYWNPLEYDEDAFRLMVDCGIDVEMGDRVVVAVLYGREGIIDSFGEHHGTDRHAATRRAIVRASAAMGEEL